MSDQREAFVEKLNAARSEMAKAGIFHKRDLSKHIRDMERELRDYDRFQQEAGHEQVGRKG